MKVDIYIYKRFDTDLLALHDAGYSISKMIKEALEAYAGGHPCFFFLDEMVPINLNEKKSVRMRIKVEDPQAVALLQNLKHGFRSNFCKQVLRNSFLQQNLFCYMAEPAYAQLHNINASFININALPNVKLCSQYKKSEKTINILGKDIAVTYEHKQAVPVLPTQTVPQVQYVQPATPLIQPVTEKPTVPEIKQVEKKAQPAIVPTNALTSEADPLKLKPDTEPKVIKQQEPEKENTELTATKETEVQQKTIQKSNEEDVDTTSTETVDQNNTKLEISEDEKALMAMFEGL